MTPVTTEPEDWHRFFAIESNNQAWSLAESPSPRSDIAAILDAAHAASFHWSQAGGKLNRMRANLLVAQAHALAGFGDSAIRYADEVRDFFVERDTPDWEIALVHTVHANAAHAAGQPDRHRTSYEAARKAIDAIEKDPDREIVLLTFSQVPAPE